MTNEQAAWLAGFIDGEGYLGLTYQVKAVSNQSAASPRYHPYLIITNTDSAAIERIKKLLGVGRVYTITSKSPHKSAYQLKITKGADLLPVLARLQPFLIIKQRQCNVLTSWLQRRMGIKPITGRGRRGVTSFGQYDDTIYHQLLNLNRRGRVLL